jgi:hypothetical protein
VHTDRLSMKICEVIEETGSGVVLAFTAAQSQQIFGRRDILTLGIDVNRNAWIEEEDINTARTKRCTQIGCQ